MSRSATTRWRQCRKSADTSLLEINVEGGSTAPLFKPVNNGAAPRPRPPATVRLEAESQAPWVKPG